jgi:hypothetical protein
MSVQKQIEYFASIGKFHMHSHDDFTFSASVELFVKAKGVDFKIYSGFKHSTPTSALDELERRVKETFVNLNQHKQIENKESD